MNRTKRVAAKVLWICIVILLITLHIWYLCWERGGFAVGSEWFVYMLAIIGLLWRFTNDD